MDEDSEEPVGIPNMEGDLEKVEVKSKMLRARKDLDKVGFQRGVKQSRPKSAIISSAKSLDKVERYPTTSTKVKEEEEEKETPTGHWLKKYYRRKQTKNR